MMVLRILIVFFFRAEQFSTMLLHFLKCFLAVFLRLSLNTHRMWALWQNYCKLICVLLILNNICCLYG